MNNRSKGIKIRNLLVCLMVWAGVFYPAAGAASAAADDASVQKAAQGINAFAVDLYGRLSQEGRGNLFFSPYSISTALAMTYAGAEGDTARQMAKVLYLGPDRQAVHAAFSRLMHKLNSPQKSYQLAVANALWAQKGYPLRDEFLKTTVTYYEAGCRAVDFKDEKEREASRRKINRWVEGKTNKKIKDLLAPKMLTSLTRLVLTNAIYFKGQWVFQFKAEATKPMPFSVSPQETAPVPMMHQTAEFKYAENDKVQILEMPYAGGDLAMLILLPHSELGMAGLERIMTTKKIESWTGSLSKNKVEVFLPKFRLEMASLLNDKLQGLGMEDAFEESRADFSGMTPGGPGLYISKVVHKAFVDVNEEGTEAAAATAVIMAIKSVMSANPVFRAD
ncbi:MAG: serpin family protein, partial [Pseudomonadota bacterium]